MTELEKELKKNLREKIESKKRKCSEKIRALIRYKLDLERSFHEIEKILKLKNKRGSYSSLFDSFFNKADRGYIRNLFGNRCFNCGSKKNLQIDHHVPLSFGYPLKFNDEYNAVLLCKRCNNKKSSLLPHRFYRREQLKELEENYNITSHLDIEYHRDKELEKLYLEYILELENLKKFYEELYLDFKAVGIEKRLKISDEEEVKLYYFLGDEIKLFRGEIERKTLLNYLFGVKVEKQLILKRNLILIRRENE